MGNAWDRLDPDFGEPPDWRSSRIQVGKTIHRADGRAYRVTGVWYATDTHTRERLGQVDLRDVETKKRSTVEVFALEAELTECAGKTAWQRLGEGTGEESAAPARRLTESCKACGVPRSTLCRSDCPSRAANSGVE